MLFFLSVSVYVATLLPGLLQRETFFPTLTAAAALSALFLPFFFGWKAEEIALIFAVCGGFLGLLAGAEYFFGFAPGGWVDAAGGHTGGRACALFANPNTLCAFLLPCFFLGLGLLCQTEGRKKKLLLCPLPFFSLLGIGATFCRGGWVALLLSLLLFLCLRRRFFSLAVAAAAAPGIFLSFPPVLRNRFFSLFSPDSSAGYRISLWRSVMDMPKAFFLFGTGEGKAALHRALLPGAAAGLEAVEHTHSLFLHVLCAGGILALLALLFLLLLSLSSKKTGIQAAFCGGLVSLLLFGLFDDPFYTIQTGVVFWLLISVNLSLQFSSFSS